MIPVLLRKIKQYWRNDSIELSEKLLNFLLVGITISIFILGCLSWLFKQSAVSIIANYVAFGLSCGIAYISLVCKKHNLAAILLISVFNFIIMPVLFFTAGGNNSGLPLWFVMWIYLAGLMTDGVTRVILVVLSLIVDITCMVLGYIYPDMIIPLASEQAIYNDILQSFIVVNMLVVILTAIHRDSYEEQQQKLRRIALTDELTGLYNRRAYYEDTKQIDYDNTVYVSIDVNGLKYVNDNLGHSAGDELIKGASDVLQSVFNTYGIVYRVGGDEFIVVLQSTPEQMDILIQELEEAVSNWSGGLVDRMSMAKGYVCCKDFNGKSFAVIEKVAEDRMYADKERYYATSNIPRRKGNHQ